MSFNKSYVDKDRVLNRLRSNNDITKLVNADAVVMDVWCNNFFKNYSFVDGNMLSNYLENLIKSPSEYDLLKANEILGSNYDLSDCIDVIIKKYDI